MSSLGEEAKDWIVSIATAVVLALIIRTFIVELYLVDGPSMRPTLQSAERLVVNKFIYRFREPERGDIVTFADPQVAGRTLIKRVIAVGGQTVDLQGGSVYVDGEKLDEPYTLGKPSEPLSADLTYPYTVPEGYIWCMGDNRTNSSDSRDFGPVPLENVTGHAFFRYWPFDRIGTLE